MNTEQPPKRLHQIWIGPPLPARESAWVERLRQSAERAGWQHTLWDWPALQAAYGHEPIATLFERALATLASPTTYTLMSDYYRWRVLAEEGGLYLDTDFELRAERWPRFPSGNELGLTTEYFTRARMCNCMLWAPAAAAARLAAETAAAHLQNLLPPPDSPDFGAAYIDLVRRDKGGLARRGIGPVYCHRRLLPLLNRAGHPHQYLPATLIGHIQWGGGAALVHHGTAHWHEGPKSQQTAFWNSLSEGSASRFLDAPVDEQAAAILARPPEDPPKWAASRSLSEPVNVAAVSRTQAADRERPEGARLDVAAASPATDASRERGEAHFVGSSGGRVGVSAVCSSTGADRKRDEVPFEGSSVSRVGVSAVCPATSADRKRGEAPWQQPQGRAIIPNHPQAHPGNGSQSPPKAETPQWPGPLPLPRGAKRIIILSNITSGFGPEQIPLQAGDLVLHCNHARHAAAAMAIPGTWHHLFVRHGHGRDPRGWHWYHEGSFDGFERVIFIDDATCTRPFRWLQEYRRRSGKSPTTGFILANMARELYPHIPLILGGFDPLGRHGTPQWEGHDWAAEAAWYEEKNFQLIRPQNRERIAVIATSCHGYTDRRHRAKDSHGCYLQRRAWRRACARMMPGNMQSALIVGEGPSIHEPRLIQLPCPDTYNGLPAKIKAAFRHALEHIDFEWLYKCDDDTFIHPGRLAQHISQLPSGSLDIYGGPCRDNPRNICGGAGYILSRRAIEHICRDPQIPDYGREDVEICRSIIRNGGRLHIIPLLRPDASEPPSASNSLISAHHMNPRQLLAAHAACYHT